MALAVAQQQPLAARLGHRRCAPLRRRRSWPGQCAGAGHRPALPGPGRAQSAPLQQVWPRARTRGRWGAPSGSPMPPPAPGNGPRDGCRVGECCARSACLRSACRSCQNHRIDLVQAFQHMATGHQQAKFMQGAGGCSECGGVATTAHKGTSPPAWPARSRTPGPAPVPPPQADGHCGQQREQQEPCEARSAISARRGFPSAHAPAGGRWPTAASRGPGPGLLCSACFPRSRCRR